MHLVCFIIRISSCQYSEAQTTTLEKRQPVIEVFLATSPHKKKKYITMVPTFHCDNGPLFWFQDRKFFFNFKSSHFFLPTRPKKKHSNFIHQQTNFSSHKIADSINRGGCYVIGNVFPSSSKELTHTKSSTEVAGVTVIRAKILHVFVCHP